MQDVVEAAVEQRRLSRCRLRDERRSQSHHVTPASELGSIPEVVYNTPPATAGRSGEEMEMSVIVDGRDAGATGDTSRPTAEITEQGRARVPKWTVLQAWSVFGFATCTVPWYLAYDVEKKEYVLKSFGIQQIFCILQHVISLLVTVLGLSRVPQLMTNNLGPFSYVQILGVLLAIATRLWFTKVVFFNRNSILEYHNMDDDMDLAETGYGEQASNSNRTNRNGSHSNFKVIGISFLCFSLFAVLMIGTDFGIELQDYDEDWKSDGFPAIVQTFSCFARMTYFWKNLDTCGLPYIEDKVSDLPTSEVSWGIGGFVTFMNSKMAQYQKFIAINTCIWMFYLDATYAMMIIQNPDRRAIQIYNFLKERAEWLSSFAGLLLFLQLLEIATNIPEWSVVVFTKNVFIPMYIVTILACFFLFLVLGSYATLIADKVEEELVGQRGRSSRPSTPRQMASFLFQLFRNSVGIGIRGIYTLNFPFLVSYMSATGTLVMVLYQVTH